MGYVRVLGVIAAAALFAMSLGGCGLFYWGKPGSTAEQFDRDNKECAVEATQTPGGQVVREVFDKAYRQCLLARGYVRQQQVSPGPDWHRGIE